MVLIFNY